MKLEVQQLLAQLREARQDAKACDRMIGQYLPFIRSETAKFLGRPPVPEGSPSSLTR